MRPSTAARLKARSTLPARPCISPEARPADRSGCTTYWQHPGDADSTATLASLLSMPQAPLTKEYTVAAHSRFTIDIAAEAPVLKANEMSAHITSDHPIVVERAMYRHGDGQAFAACTTAGRCPHPWSAGSADASTDGSATVTLVYEDGTSEEQIVTLPRQRRTTDDAGTFSHASGKRFGILISSNGVPIVVERSL